jgi:nucleotide-binding universal stress UspA family protein
MYERILVPVDGSEPSVRALEEAVAMTLGHCPAPASAAIRGPASEAAASHATGSHRPSLKVVHVLDDALDQSELIARETPC